MKVAIMICVLFLTALMATVSNADSLAFASGGSFGLNSAQAFGSNGPIRMQIPSFPALPWPSNIPFPQFSKFPTFSPLNTIKPFTFQGITAQGGTSGGQFNGVAVVSHQQTTNKKDGKLGTTGGSTMVFNDNGKITVQQTGDAPPPVSITQFKDPPVSSL